MPEILRQLRVMGEAGFTVAHVEAIDPPPQLFDEAERLGVRLIFAPTKAAVCTQGPSALHAMMDRIKDEPSLLAYNLADDLHDGPLVGCPRNVDDVSAMYDNYKTRDPSRSFFVALGNGPFSDTVFTKKRFDIPAVEIYPINGGSPIRLVYESVLETVTLAAPWDQSPWVILQTFNWGGPQQRYPTPAEYANMMYQSLVAGARGTINYTFRSLETQPQLLAAVKGLVPELKRLSRFLVNGKFTRTALGSGLYGATWEDGQEVLAIVVNAGNYGSHLDPKMNPPSTRQVSLPLPAGATGPAVAPLPGRPAVMTVSGGRLVGSIDLLGVAVNIVPKP